MNYLVNNCILSYVKYEEQITNQDTIAVHIKVEKQVVGTSVVVRIKHIHLNLRIEFMKEFEIEV